MKSEKRKIKKLTGILKKLGSVVVAYSGGVDSTFLLKAAVDVLGKGNVIAVTAKSELFPQSELKEAGKIASTLGIRHVIITSHELKNKNFRRNPVNRCYYCKKELFTRLKKVATRQGFKNVADGTNYDDLKDIRYGRLAASELGVKSPLAEARLAKEAIRKLSKETKLPTWDKGTFACLASRLPHHQAIKRRDLKRIEVLEEFLKRLGFRQIRARKHDNLVRIELGPDEIREAADKKIRRRIINKCREEGFRYITLDLAGYCAGSMNEPEPARKGA